MSSHHRISSKVRSVFEGQGERLWLTGIFSSLIQTFLASECLLYTRKVVETLKLTKLSLFRVVIDQMGAMERYVPAGVY